MTTLQGAVSLSTDERASWWCGRCGPTTIAGTFFAGSRERPYGSRAGQGDAATSWPATQKSGVYIL